LATRPLRAALGGDLKGKISPVLYLSGIVLAFVNPWPAMLAVTSVASMWPFPTDDWSGLCRPGSRVLPQVAGRRDPTAGLFRSNL